MLNLGALFIVFGVAASCCRAQPLPAMGAAASDVTASGISAGAAMAQQLLVAYSTSMAGAGAIAGPPYYCAQDSMATAISTCMMMPSMISLSSMYNYASSAASDGKIDPLSSLAGKKVWLYSGTSDSVVNSGSVAAGKTFFDHFSADTTFVNSVASQHAWITSNYGSTCATLGSPFINNCDYDAAGTLLTYIFGSLNAPGTFNASALHLYEQKYYTGGTPENISMYRTGWVYVPEACHASGTACRVHIALHGCEMSPAYISDKFAVHSGLNEWAETNNLIVLYPQATTMTLYNPNACFDWWGYTTPDYAVQTGPQMAAIWKMVQALTASA